MSTRSTTFSVGDVTIRSFLAGEHADRPAVEVALPGAPVQRMSPDAALHLAARLIRAARHAEAGREGDHPVSPTAADSLREVLERGEAVGAAMLAEMQRLAAAAGSDGDEPAAT